MRKSENFYRRDPSKALAGMVGLTLEERGVYNTVLDLLYSTWRPLEDDRSFIAGWCGAAPQKVNPIIRRLIEKGRLITFEEGGRVYLSDAAFEAERASVKGVSETRSGRGEVGEKSREVGEKSEKHTTSQDEMPEKQSVARLEKRREEKKETPIPPRGLFGEDFDSFWAAYPKKVGKPQAAKSFAKAIKRSDIRTILAGLDRAKASRDWVKNGGQFIPHPTTWLNRDGWNDNEADPDPPGTKRLSNGHLFNPAAPW